MELPNLKDMILGDKKVVFVRFQDNQLWYQADNGFEFPIPVDDAAGGTFLAEDQASFFMRWIRKHLDYLRNVVQGESAQQTLPFTQ